jgi:hypothetical protein
MVHNAIAQSGRINDNKITKQLKSLMFRYFITDFLQNSIVNGNIQFNIFG